MVTKLIRSFGNITPNQQEGVVTIGNFDGVHLGHRQLIAEITAKAQDLGVESLLMTFEPHPMEFFSQPALMVPRLTRLREKFKALSKLNLNNVLVVPFDQNIANINASDFVEKWLYTYLRPQHIFVGDDFRFGYKRQGDFHLLQSMGKTLGFFRISYT